MAKLIYKIAITGEIKVITGLHIGGSDSVLDIGGIDNSIIKTKGKVPYIPGSSLKGKLRTLIARINGYPDVNTDEADTETLFSGSYQIGTNQNGKRIRVKKTIPTRLLTRDSFVLRKQFDVHEKAENVISRTTGEAKPRLTERVSPDSIFGLDMILDVYDEDKNCIVSLLNTLKLGFQLLENDYLGGSGSRGYGKIEFEIFPLSFPFKNEGEEPIPEVINFKLKG